MKKKKTEEEEEEEGELAVCQWLRVVVDATGAGNDGTGQP